MGRLDDSLFISYIICADGLPGHRKAFIEPELLPHLKAFFTPQRPAFDHAMNLTMLKAVLIPGIVETGVLSVVFIAAEIESLRLLKMN